MSLTPSTRKELATAVVAAQWWHVENGGAAAVKVNSIATLLKRQPEVLREMLSSLLDSHGLMLADDGSVVQKVQVDDVLKNDEAPGAKRGGRALQPAEGVITVVATANPKRDGSASHARFDLLRSGQTVAEFISAVEKATGTHRGARRTLRKAVVAGLVVVS